MRKIIFFNLLFMCTSGVWAHNTSSDAQQDKECLCGEHDCPEAKEQKEIKETSQKELSESSGA